ncbi:MAG TPA: ABC transporter ATP-binding protein [Alphaproteobacteria bacterium]|nr:ABC transporter ATP-binding protein [Alphaproteobacteria bacterium]
MSEAVLQLRNIQRTFSQAGNNLHVLRGCSLDIMAGEQVALIGPSGSGKSTLLHTAGLLERPDAGTIVVGGKDASKLDEMGRTLMRRETIGFVYQFHHLLPEFSALENIMLPQMLAGIGKEAARRRASELLNLVGLMPRADHRPARLSGGEQQRVALVRALANKPKILIADEPTGNLDPQTADQMFEVLQNLVQTQNLALLMATHNHELADRMSRVLEIKDGIVAEL